MFSEALYQVSVFNIAVCHTSKGFTTNSNINEVITVIWNFFIQTFYNHKKAKNAYKQIKIKHVYNEHLSSNVNEVIETIVA